MDVAFYLSVCQLPPAPGANSYTGFGKRMKKMGREQRGGCCLGNGVCSGISVWLDFTLVEEGGCWLSVLTFAEDQRGVGHW